MEIILTRQVKNMQYNIDLYTYFRWIYNFNCIYNKPTTDSLSNYSTDAVAPLQYITPISLSSGSTIDSWIYGTFDPDSSDTFSSNGISFYFEYADSTYAHGTSRRQNMELHLKAMLMSCRF